MRSKIGVGVLCGGKSGEHQVSLMSSKSIVDAIDRNKYDLIIIGIHRDGRWTVYDSTNYLINADDPKNIGLLPSNNHLQLSTGVESSKVFSTPQQSTPIPIDVIFPVLHGPYGEDGTVQGLLKLFGLPFVGPGVASSSVCMDKDVSKRLLRDSGIPIADFVILNGINDKNNNYDKLAELLGTPLFIKPSNCGSSIGVSKVNNVSEYTEAVRTAFCYDRKILVEEFVLGREIECSVLGNQNPIASVLGEIKPIHDFYSYEAKYIDDHGATLHIPADLDENVSSYIREFAVKSYQALCCEGMARVDFFLKPDGRFIVNEINTIPGFTQISMYPKLWEASGISYPELIDRIIQLGLERFQIESAIKID